MKKNTIFFGIFLLLVLTTYNFNSDKNLINYFFGIKKIEVLGLSYFEKNGLEEKIEDLKGKNIIFTNSKDLTKIVSKFNFVKGFTIRKKYPREITIIIKEYKPIGIFTNKTKQSILLEEGKSVQLINENKFMKLPKVNGINASKNFFILNESLKHTNFDKDSINEFKYYKTNRWDIILKNGKIIKLPSENYENSLIKFANLYKKDSFKKFNIFDFRINGQLVVK